MSEAELASDRQDVSDYERRVATRRAAHRGLRRLGRLNCQKPVSVSETISLMTPVGAASPPA